MRPTASSRPRLSGVSLYLLLCGDGQLVAGDQAGHLLHAQIEELLTPDHLGEVLLCQQNPE